MPKLPRAEPNPDATTARIDPADLDLLVTLVRRASEKAGQSVGATFETLLDAGLETLARLASLDLVGDPDLGPWSPAAPELAEAVGILLSYSAPEPTYQDVVGELFVRLGLNDVAGRAQYFTPPNVAALMGAWLIDSAELGRYTTEEPLRCCDNACGSGRLLLAVAAALPREFVDAGRLKLVGLDVDERCVKMARFNLTVYGLARPEPRPKMSLEDRRRSHAVLERLLAEPLRPSPSADRR